MVQSLHHLIDQLTGILLPLVGEVEIDHGGFQLGMPHVSLDDAEVHTGFQEMCGIGVTEGVHGDILFEDPCLGLGMAEGALNTALGHGRESFSSSFMVSAKSGKEQERMVMSAPIAAQQVQGRDRERDVAILGTLATVDVDHHAGGVDVGDFEVKTFMKPQAQGVDSGEIGIVVERFHGRQDASDFFHAENGRKAALGLGTKDPENMPATPEDVHVEEAYPAVADTHRTGRPLVCVLAMEEVVGKFFLSDEIWRLAVELGEHAHGTSVGLLRALPFAGQLEGLHHSVVPLGVHDSTPFA
jgi:hypothetical protein